MKGFDWIFFCIMVPPLLLALWELYRTRGEQPLGDHPVYGGGQADRRALR